MIELGQNFGVAPEQEKSKTDFHFIELHPEKIPMEMLREIRPKCRLDSRLMLESANATGNLEFDKDSFEFAGFRRNPVLDEMVLDDPFTHDKICPKEVYDQNMKEMERATSLKWYTVLSQIFGSKDFNKLPIRSPENRLKIALPGCHFGLEVGGILDFLNEQGIPVDIEAVDLIEQAGGAREFMSLEERCQVKGSKVDFYSETDAREFYRSKLYDMVIMRHPGFVFDIENAGMWKQITDTMAQTKPGMIIVSTFNHRTNDPQTLDVLGFQNKQDICEEEVFSKWLGEQDYSPVEEFDANPMNDYLEYPFSPYMNSYQHKEGKLRWKVPVDRYVTTYGSREYFENKNK